MTEEEWLTRAKPEGLLRYLDEQGEQPSSEEIADDFMLDRKLRLFAFACCRRIQRLLTDSRSRDALTFLESYLDGQVLECDRRSFALTSSRVTWDYERVRDGRLQAATAVYRAIDDIMDEFTDAVEVAEEAALAAALAAGGPEEDSQRYAEARTVEEAHQAVLVREIFGNPFRPVTFSPRWRTDTAVSLARQMYESRDFGAAPILADALQDAGCDSDELLNHLRDATAIHVRGCWAVDLVLGKK